MLFKSIGNLLPKLLPLSFLLFSQFLLVFPAYAQQDDAPDSWLRKAGCFAISLNPAVDTVDSFIGVFNCNNTGLAGEAIDAGFSAIGGAVANKVLGILQSITALFALIGSIVLWAGSAFLSYALSPTRFATHDIVVTGWPFIQGVANLGFIIALLAIAFGTVLRIQEFSVRRMIPRLLIAALFINFSLLIGTIVVDSSRILMAIEMQLLDQQEHGVSDIEDIPALIVKNSGLTDVTTKGIHNLIEAASGFNLDTGSISDGWTDLGQSLFAALMIWGVALAFIVIAVMMLVRYVAILLLLILSPFAYLAIAMPRAGGLATKWWKEFLKYVFYGPAVLFILILLVEAIATGGDFFGNLDDQGLNDAAFLNSIVTVILTIVLLYLAATAGRYIGMVGGSATVNFVSGKAKQAARGGGRLAIAPAAFAGRYAKKRIGENVQDFKRDTQKNIRSSEFGRSRFGKAVLGPERNKDGTLKKGESSVGSYVADKATSRYKTPSATDQSTISNAVAARDKFSRGGFAGINQALATPELSAPNMQSTDLKKALGNQFIFQTLRGSDNPGHVRAIIDDTSYLRDLSESDRNDVYMNLAQNTTMSDRDRNAGLKDLLATFKKMKEGEA